MSVQEPPRRAQEIAVILRRMHARDHADQHAIVSHFKLPPDARACLGIRPQGIRVIAIRDDDRAPPAEAVILMLGCAQLRGIQHATRLRRKHGIESDDDSRHALVGGQVGQGVMHTPQVRHVPAPQRQGRQQVSVVHPCVNKIGGLTREEAPKPQHVARPGPAWSNVQMVQYGRSGNPFAECTLASQRHHDMVEIRRLQRLQQSAQGNLRSARAQPRNDVTDPHPVTPA